MTVLLFPVHKVWTRRSLSLKLNPTEHLSASSELEHCPHPQAPHPTSVSELTNAPVAEWTHIPTVVLQNLGKSFLRILELITTMTSGMRWSKNTCSLWLDVHKLLTMSSMCVLCFSCSAGGTCSSYWHGAQSSISSHSKVIMLRKMEIRRKIRLLPETRLWKQLGKWVRTLSTVFSVFLITIFSCLLVYFTFCVCPN